LQSSRPQPFCGGQKNSQESIFERSIIMSSKMKKSRVFRTVILTLGLLLCCQAALAVEPIVVEGNPDCCDLGYGQAGFKVDGPTSDTFPLDESNGGVLTCGGLPDSGNSITITTDGTYFEWSSTLGIDAVIVKGGPKANVYVYDPESTGDTGLHSPINNDLPYAISHIEFCYDYEVDVSKDAQTTFKRTYDWDIDKSCDGPAELTLSIGQIYEYDFSWTASVTGYTDSDWAVEGTITIENNTPFTATIENVSDVISVGIIAATDCGVAYPYDLAPGASLNCSYSSSLPDDSSRVNTATVTTSGPVGGGEATADVIFGEPTEEVDECIDVTDDCHEIPVTVCVTDLDINDEYTLNYQCEIGPYDECGDYLHINTASFTTNDNAVTGEDTCEVTINVPCDVGCTLTPGYWKTHSEYGPAPYDDNWANLLNGADTTFFLSGQSYFEVLWTSPKGNAYYILAHAYIAALLNQLNGASIPVDVLAAFDEATELLETYTPEEIKALKGKAGNELRAQFIALGLTLDDYNNGLNGPGHCSEESDTQGVVLLATQNDSVVVLRLKPKVDLNGDGKVNIKDLLLLIEALSTKDSQVDIRLKSSKDGRVNPEDIEVQIIGVSK
jgi:hypothetical protein